MDTYTFTFFIAAICAALVVGYLLGLRTTRKAHEIMQRKVVDVYSDIDWCEKKYKVLKQKYQDKLDMINDLEKTNADLRKANEEMYDAGFMDGKQAGKIGVIKELGKSLIDESSVLNGNGIVKDNETVINQLKNIKLQNVKS